ncbi:MAG: tryptophan synthase subunit alpha [Eubacterium sp.]|nr:tryptophan synthase subunit alpha [Eubacterium sp.]MBR1674175.1 tryptophan synthase subunit alpha [Eubacterium sp.]
MSNIYKAFENKKAFIAFLTAGDPDFETSVECFKAVARAGADLIEVGIPFSDPIAEGPVIQEADLRALESGMTTDKVFELVKEVRKETDVPMVFMSYINPIYHYGADEFFKKAAEAGIDGAIVPDMPFEEKGELDSTAAKYGIDIISMIAPTSEDRIKMIAKEAKGFIYVVSSLGVTGVRTEIKTDLDSMIKNIREVTDVPAAIGFGISTPEQAKKMAAVADGAIVGSAMVRIVAAEGKNAPEKLYEYVKSMKDAIE